MLRSIGSDAGGAFMDLSKLVSGGGKLKGAYGDLAYKIGKPYILILASICCAMQLEAVLKPCQRTRHILSTPLESPGQLSSV